MQKQFLIKGFKELGTGNRDYGRGIVRLSSNIANQVAISRHGLVRLENLECGAVKHALYRPHNDSDCVVGLEYDDRLLLGIEEKGKKVDLRVSAEPSWFYLHYFLSHPDVNVRLTFLFSIVFCVLSAILGFLIGIILSP